MKKSFALIVLLFTCLFLSACINSDAVSGVDQKSRSFAGNWRGSGVDSDGNEFTFAAKVTALGENKYRILILDKLDTRKEPLHVMEGVMKADQFIYTADEGMYIGSGKLDNDMFEGYYKGPVDGTYKMQRIK